MSDERELLFEKCLSRRLSGDESESLRRLLEGDAGARREFTSFMLEWQRLAEAAAQAEAEFSARDNAVESSAASAQAGQAAKGETPSPRLGATPKEGGASPSREQTVLLAPSGGAPSGFEGVGKEGVVKSAGASTVPAGRRPWLDWLAGVAAAILLAWAMSQLLESPTEDRIANGTIENLGRTDVTRMLKDGTRVTLGPETRVQVRGVDETLGIRQRIVLEKGQVEIRTGQARDGKIACRVETPDGQWAETNGGRFKVSRGWKNEEEERAMQPSRLKGLVTSVLLVAVIEGQARTGNALGEEAQVVAGGEAAIGEGPVAEIASGAEPAWGSPVKGLALRIRGGKFAPGEAILISVEMKNASQEQIKAPDIVSLDLEPWLAHLTFRFAGLGKDALSFDCSARKLIDYDREPEYRTTLLAPGASFPGRLIRLGETFRFLRVEPGKSRQVGDEWDYRDVLPAGRYRVTMELGHFAPGKVVSNAWEIVVAQAKEQERKDSEQEKIAWGVVSKVPKPGLGPLQLGLSAKANRFEKGKPLALTVHIKNVGGQFQSVVAPSAPSRWKWTFTSRDRSDEPQVLVLQEQSVAELKEKTRGIPAGGQEDVPCLVALADGSWRNYSGGAGLFSGFAPGRYSVTATYTNLATTGPVDIEIVAIAHGPDLTNLDADTSARAQALKDNLESFRLALRYHGEEDKPYYRLTISEVPSDSETTVARPFNDLIASAGKELASKLIDHLAVEGFLKTARSTLLGKKMGPPDGPCYTLTASAKGVELYEVLGWDLRMLQRLDGLRKVLKGDSAKKMDLLLDRLSGLRKGWEQEQTAWGQAVNGLQGRIQAGQATVAPGDDIRLTFWLKVADPMAKEPLFVWDNKYSEGYRNDSYLVENPKGEGILLRRPEQKGWQENAPHPIKIDPGLPWALVGWGGQANIKSMKALGLDTSLPGTYTITGVYEEAASKAKLQMKGEAKEISLWGGKLTTLPIEVVVLPGKAADGGWIKLLEDEATYKAKPGEERIYAGRLDPLRPITELHGFAYRLQLNTKEVFTLGIGINQIVEQLRRDQVEIRGKVEEGVQLYKGAGREVVLWPAAIRVVSRPEAGNPEKVEVDLSSPQKCWAAVLEAMQSGDASRVKALCTEGGYASLFSTMTGSQTPPGEFLKRLGMGWAKMEVRWGREVEGRLPRVTASLGPIKPAETGLMFCKIDEKWLFEKLGPGE